MENLRFIKKAKWLMFKRNDCDGSYKHRSLDFDLSVLILAVDNFSTEFSIVKQFDKVLKISVNRDGDYFVLQAETVEGTAWYLDLYEGDFQLASAFFLQLSIIEGAIVMVDENYELSTEFFKSEGD